VDKAPVFWQIPDGFAPLLETQFGEDMPLMILHRLHFDLEPDCNGLVTQAFFQQLEHCPFTTGQENTSEWPLGRAFSVRDRNTDTVGVGFAYSLPVPSSYKLHPYQVDLVASER
jgi:hypothetical protein